MNESLLHWERGAPRITLHVKVCLQVLWSTTASVTLYNVLSGSKENCMKSGLGFDARNKLVTGPFFSYFFSYYLSASGLSATQQEFSLSWLILQLCLVFSPDLNLLMAKNVREDGWQQKLSISVMIQHHKPLLTCISEVITSSKNRPTSFLM